MALYRKYRPHTWKDVIGEDHIVSVLSQEIELDKLAHAYLFSGSRGTGKTSVARIFAREIGTSANDIYEIDAASNNGVDEVRSLTEGVHTLPFDSKYKVYIMDEAHMLSKSAWNALLKTLEEPPQHVIFILATTELEKVPETVISRCQTFAFKKPNQSTLKEFVTRTGKSEGFTIEASAAELVALLGDGSFRDAHGILEKVLSSTTDKKITREEVERVSAVPKAGLVRDILESIVLKDMQKGLEAIQTAGAANADMKIFARLILEHLRYLFLIRLKAGMDEHIKKEVAEDEFEFLRDLAAKATKDLTADILLLFVRALEDSGRTAIATLPLELALSEAVSRT